MNEEVKIEPMKNWTDATITQLCWFFFRAYLGFIGATILIGLPVAIALGILAMVGKTMGSR